MIRTRRSPIVLLSFLFLSAVSTLAFAQDPASSADTPTPAPAPPPRGVVVLDAGTAFGNTEAHLAFTGGVGFSLGSHLQVGGEFGRFDNLVTKTLAGNVRDTAAILSASAGAPVTAATSAPADYGLATVRVAMWTSPHMGVFADAGVGVAHINPQLSAVAGGVDVSGEILQSITLAPSATALYTTVGGGVSVRLGRRATIDAGYRFGRLGTATPAYTNALYGGWRLGF